MEDALSSFRKREKALRRKHIRMSQGYVTKVDRNGLIVQKPDSKIGGWSVRLLIRLAIVFMAIKLFLLSWMGAPAYVATLDQLAKGSAFEQVGGWFMQIDPITNKLLEMIVPFIG